MKINAERLTWLFKREANWDPDREISEYDPAWWAAGRLKWHYTIYANIDEQGALSFTVSRHSQNDGLHSDGIGRSRDELRDTGGG